MAGVLEDYSGIGAVSAAVQGFTDSYEKAQDRQYKDIERKAQLEALKSKSEREAFEHSLPARKQKIMVDLAGHGQEPEFNESGELTGTKYKPEYLQIQEKKASADPFGLKATAAENAKKPKEFELTAAGFARRMEGAEKILQELAADKSFDPSSTMSQAQGYLPGALESVKDPKLKSYEQAKRNFITANLRKESGASIGRNEYLEEEKKYFAQPGDTPELAAQKAQARAQAMANLSGTAGNAMGVIKPVPSGVLPKGNLKSGNLSAKPPAQQAKPKTIKQGGFVYTLNEQTGEYE